METNVHYTIVGAFVIVLVTAIVLAVIWLSSGFSLEQYSTYMVYMKESVSGLSVDSAVEYNGVDVGTVASIDLNQENPQLVELLLNIKDRTPITKGTVATLTTRGLTGLVYIALKDKSQDLRPLVAENGQRYPVIKTAPSIFVRLDTALSDLSTNLKLVSQSISSVLDPENRKSIKETLHSMQQFSETLANNTQKLDKILKNTADASNRLTPLLESSTNAMKTLQTQTLPMTYQTIYDLNQVVRTLSGVASQLQQNPSVLLRGKGTQPLGPGERK